MPGEPVETFIGIAGIGVGALLMYGAYKNINVIGKNGLLAKVIAGDKFISPDSLEKQFENPTGPTDKVESGQEANPNSAVNSQPSTNPSPTTQTGGLVNA